MEPKKKFEMKVQEYVSNAVKVFFVIVFAILIMALVVYGTMYLWNWLMTDIFNLRTINYWEALGLLVLAKILFGFGNHSSKSKNHKTKKKGKIEDWCKSRSAFSEWKHYDSFWKEEGEQAYKAYVERMENGEENEKSQ